MESRKICRLLIVVFLLLNILFAALYVAEYNGVSVLTDEFADNAVENLNKSGILISKDIIQMKTPDDSVYMFETEEQRTHGENTAYGIASAVFGEKDIKVVSFETPDGVSVGIYSDSDELAKIVLKYENFGIKYTDSAYSKDTALPENAFENVFDEFSRSDEKAISDFADGLCKNSGFGYKITGVGTDGDASTVCIVQTAGDKEIDGMFLNLSLSDGRIYAAQGNWLTYSLQKQFYNPLIDGINVLYRLPLDGIAEILSEEIVYSPRRTEENIYYLMPVWKIKYVKTDGEHTCSYIDAVMD